MLLVREGLGFLGVPKRQSCRHSRRTDTCLHQMIRPRYSVAHQTIGFPCCTACQKLKKHPLPKASNEKCKHRATNHDQSCSKLSKALGRAMAWSTFHVPHQVWLKISLECSHAEERFPKTGEKKKRSWARRCFAYFAMLHPRLTTGLIWVGQLAHRQAMHTVQMTFG